MPLNGAIATPRPLARAFRQETEQSAQGAGP